MAELKAKNKLRREGAQKIDLLWNGKVEVYYKGWRRWMMYKRSARVSDGRSGVF